MKTYIEPSKEIPIADEADVLVVGGGPAGVGAALAAARRGARTLLIEQSGAVGGVATTGLMSHWTGATEHIGLYGEILRRAQDASDVHLINPEKLKTVLLDLLSEAGVTWLLYTFAVEVIMDGDTIRGVLTEDSARKLPH